jgi:hypothetical protein
VQSGEGAEAGDGFADDQGVHLARALEGMELGYLGESSVKSVAFDVLQRGIQSVSGIDVRPTA